MKRDGAKIQVDEMHMQRLICGVARNVRIREFIGGNLQVILSMHTLRGGWVGHAVEKCHILVIEGPVTEIRLAHSFNSCSKLYAKYISALRLIVWRCFLSND